MPVQKGGVMLRAWQCWYPETWGTFTDGDCWILLEDAQKWTRDRWFTAEARSSQDWDAARTEWRMVESLQRCELWVWNKVRLRFDHTRWYIDPCNVLLGVRPPS